jgi:biopolymer transport protein ExbB
MADLSNSIALLIQRGGWVMIPLLALSVVSLALIAERIWFWVTINRPSRLAQLSGLTTLLRRRDHKTAAEFVAKDNSPYGVVVRRLIKDGTSDSVALEAVEDQRPRIDRFMVMLSTVITAAPLLGILGTVIGIIRSFDLLGTQGTLTDPRVVSTGIAEALMTTALGLVIALFTLFPYMVFRGQVGKALGWLELIVAAAQQGNDVYGDKGGRSADGDALRRAAPTRRGETRAASSL